MLRILVPAYFRPSGEGLRHWERLIDAARHAPVVAIVNPQSGPGAQLDPDYTRIIQEAVRSGVTCIGYISTRYGKRPPAEVREDIDRWNSFYPDVHGFFFDEQAEHHRHVNHYRALTRYSRRSLHDPLVVSNAGLMCSPDFFTRHATDVICVSENSRPPEASPLPDWLRNVPRHRICVLAHSQATDHDVRRSVASAVAQEIGFLYVTDDVLPNPWDRLPSFWDQLVREVRAVNEPVASMVH